MATKAKSIRLYPFTSKAKRKPVYWLKSHKKRKR